MIFHCFTLSLFHSYNRKAGTNMKPYDLPPRPEGELPEQIRQLWEALFRLTERLNAEKKL